MLSFFRFYLTSLIDIMDVIYIRMFTPKVLNQLFSRNLLIMPITMKKQLFI